MLGLSPPSLVTLFAFAATLPCSFALPGHTARDDHDHAHVSARSLPGTWYQRDDHPAHALFKRDSNTDGQTYPTVGSPEWRAKYPDPKPDPSKNPQEWTDALNAAIKAGKIPDIDPSTATGGNPKYSGSDPGGNGPDICSSTAKCRSEFQIWDAPEGMVGISFDDGPLPVFSDRLYDFLEQSNTSSTHFFIGINVLNNAPQFMKAFEGIQADIAVHTWTHPYMTTLTNEQVLAELGWTMQIIHDSAGGRLPQYWRPPYGDSDRRVSAIAYEVFGMTTVLWNQDTEDWSIGEPQGTTVQKVTDSLTKWYQGSKTPGLIILEHELTNDSVGAFISTYPLIAQNGWKAMSVVQLDGGSAYQNADGDDGSVQLATNVLAFNGTSSSASGPAPTSAGSSGSPANPSASGSHSVSGSAAPNATSAAQQPNGASLLVAYDVRSVLASLFTLLVSAFALA